MTDILNNINLTAPSITPKTESPVEQAVIPASTVNTPIVDKVEISSENKKSQGPIKTVKGFIANVKKFFSSSSEYVKGGVKGITSAVVAGSVIYTGGSLINSVKGKAAEKAGKAARKIPSKFLAVIAGGLALAGSLWKASLNASEKRSDIEHRWTGH